MREKVREEIAEIIYSQYGGYPGCSNHMLADRILDLSLLAEYFNSQPVELIAERKCVHCVDSNILSFIGDDGRYTNTCPDCNGSKVFSRQLTQKEAAEILKQYVEYISTIPEDERILYITTSSGERVRAK